MREDINIVVVCGGFSSEREISFQSSLAVAKSLVKNGYKTSLLDIADPDQLIEVKQNKEIVFKPKQFKCFNHEVVSMLIDTLKRVSHLKIFLGLHGGEGENGKLQSLFDLCNFSYTGSGYKSSAICMDKVLCKVLAQFEKIPTADSGVSESSVIPGRVFTSKNWGILFLSTIKSILA